MGILAQLERPDFRPSKSDRALIAYLRENARTAPHSSIALLARAAGVGESTVTRFAKKMGYGSLQRFKVALAEELAEKARGSLIHRDITSGESALVTGRKLLAANVGALEATLAALPEGIIEQCAGMLLAGKRLRFIGLGNSGFTARDAAYQFYYIGLDSIGMDNGHEMLIMGSMARAGDVMVAISQSAATPEVMRSLELAHAGGARCILVTAEPSAAALPYVDACICYEARESPLERGSVTVKLTQFFIMDLLYTQVVKGMPDAALANKRRTVEALHPPTAGETRGTMD